MIVRKHLYILIALALLIGGAASAQRRQTSTHNLIGIYADGSWSAMLSSQKELAPGLTVQPGRNGYGLSIGFDYEYEWEHLLLNTGIGFRWQQSETRVSDQHTSLPLVDIQGYKMDFHYQMRLRSDLSRLGYMQIPLMVGAMYDHLYFMGGVKLNVAMVGITAQSTRITTYSEYDRYSAPIINTDQHGNQTDVLVDDRNLRLSIRPDLALSAEIGLNFGTYNPAETGYGAFRRPDTRFRLGLFVDYGLIGLKPSATNVLYSLPDNFYDLRRMELPHVYSTTMAQDARLTNLYVGVKLTVLWGVNRSFYCATCEMNKVQRGKHYHKRGGRVFKFN